MDGKDCDEVCRYCAKADLQCLVSGRNIYTAEDQFDEYWDLAWVYRKNNCPLCRLLIKCLLEGCQITEADFDCNGSIQGVYTRHELKLSIDLGNRRLRSSHSIQLCSATHRSLLESYEGRRQVRFDPKELSSWLENCFSKHQSCLEAHHTYDATAISPPKSKRRSHLTSTSSGSIIDGASKRDLPAGFRLVDVQRGCIIVPDATPSYYALSYVWGGTTQIILTTQSLGWLEQENALFTDALPKTISDAMNLCRQVGQQYLWVDSLCIINDDDNKYHQINTMDIIYSRALLIIIAASGSDANAGLLEMNVDRHFTLHHETVRKLEVFSAPSPQVFSEKIANSKWATRGWTLQEYCLARRAVIFAGDYVFFQCREALWAESFGMPFLDMQMKTSNWSLRVPNISHDPVSGFGYQRSFERVLGHYIYRYFTQEQDFLNAFRGILHHFAPSIGSHQWGLPASRFGLALQWSHAELKATFRRKGFPSWSWTGWHYDKLCTNETVSSGSGPNIWYADAKLSVLAAFCVTEDGNIECFDECDASLARRLPQMLGVDQRDVKTPSILESHFSRPPRSKSVVAHQISRIQNVLPECIPHSVTFWTSYAKIPVGRYPMTRPRGDPRLYSFRVELPNCSIVFPLLPAWRKSQPDSIHCIVTAVFYDGYRKYTREHILSYSVLILERYVGTDVDVFSRALAPTVSFDTQEWESASPEKRLITLL